MEQRERTILFHNQVELNGTSPLIRSLFRSVRSPEQPREQRYKADADEGDTAAGHQLVDTLGLGAG